MIELVNTRQVTQEFISDEVILCFGTPPKTKKKNIFFDVHDHTAIRTWRC